MKIKEHILSALFFFFLLFILLHPDITLKASAEGMKLWAEVVFPALFPFFVLSALITHIHWTDYVSNLFTFFMKPVFNVSKKGSIVLLIGVFSGFPVGAKMTAELYHNNLISLSDANKLLCFTNGASPMFLIGAVAGGFLHSPAAGITIFLCHLTGNLLIGVAAGRLIKGESLSSPESRQSLKMPLIPEFQKAVSQSVQQLIIIGGLIIFFSVAASILEHSFFFHTINSVLTWIKPDSHYSEEIVSAFITGLIEMSNGADLLSELHLSFDDRVLLILAIVSFGGLCVHFQVMSFILHTPISYKVYLLSRIVHLFLSPALYLIYTSIASNPSATPAFIPDVQQLDTFTTTAILITITGLCLGVYCLLQLHKAGDRRA
ncbi:nucleoside recognition domain-containing protein [Jeotgalibacillus aurantiacus]|uniref:nucleoside recognition domain-containing protein n=1 Tax=Jeotgalibacillus aurantiacus TaxID=2763266 RepID=UPI001D0A76B8|nr:nucleoside recognition domain-containing protein [Jeotgalibacillus aurantiacus]